MLKGTGISDGIGLGKAIIFKSQKIKLEKNKIKDVTLEKEKFYKANVSVRGSGIGLAVTNEIVNLHHGKLEIDSQEGKGTLVTIYLPVENSPTKNELNDMKQNETVQDAEINEGVEINKNWKA